MDFKFNLHSVKLEWKQQATSNNRRAAKKSRKSGEGRNWCREYPKNKKSKKIIAKNPRERL